MAGSFLLHRTKNGHERSGQEGLRRYPAATVGKDTPGSLISQPLRTERRDEAEAFWSPESRTEDAEKLVEVIPEEVWMPGRQEGKLMVAAFNSASGRLLKS